MSSRLALALGVAVIAAGLAGLWWAVRDREPVTTEAGSDASSSTPVSVASDAPLAPTTVRPGPELATPVTFDASGPDLPTQFDEETRDPAWAPGVERELAKRLGKLPTARVGRIECRRSRCRVTLHALSLDQLATATSGVESSLGGDRFARWGGVIAPAARGDDGYDMDVYLEMAR